MIVKTKFLSLLLLLATNVFGQQPVMLEPGLISDNGAFGFTLSPDGKEAFWVKSNGGRDTLYLMHSVKVKGKWKTPELASFSTASASWNDIDPMFSPDGNTLLFQSTRPVAGKPDREGFDIWAVKKTPTGWGDPYHLGNVINSDASESFASMAKSGNIYFMKQNPDAKYSSDLYVSRYDEGTYLEPENLGAPINTSFRESNPHISPGEDYMIYFSSDTTGYGSVDLVLSRRSGNTWSTPVNLGKPINSETGEFCPFYHEKEKRLYFSRTTATPGGRRIENIYWVPFDPEKAVRK
jgi:Tol biopolymer transport system component